jgi:hypothetical protein
MFLQNMPAYLSIIHPVLLFKTLFLYRASSPRNREWALAFKVAWCFNCIKTMIFPKTVGAAQQKSVVQGFVSDNNLVLMPIFWFGRQCKLQTAWLALREYP